MNRRILVAAVAAAFAPSTASAQQPVVTPEGEVRVRFEAERPSVRDTFDVFSLLRTRLGVGAAFGEGTRAFIQVQDSRVFGEEAGTLDGSADVFDLHQGWLELSHGFGSTDVALRAGRQEIALGSERLVGAVGWSNVGRSFDGVRLTASPARGSWALTGFAATLDERGSRVGEAGPGTQPRSDQSLFGIHLDGPLDAFVFHDRNAAFRDFTAVDRTTLGGRLDAPAALPVEAHVEGAYQLGDQVGPSGTQDIGAWLLGGRLALPFEESPLRSVGLGLDWLSGDEDTGDADYGAFQTLYATNHKFYGYLDLFTDPAAQTGDRGLVDGMVNVKARIAAPVGLEVDLHRFWFAEARAGEERAIGWELDVTLPLTLSAGSRVSAGYSLFRADRAAELIGLGAEGDLWHWGYLMASVAFRGSGGSLAAGGR